ncbi:YfiR family protein [Janthinobacterium fluminis]|uniref:YfiR family protein n=1 Tax=Janthinobacterium fluminis TaxID=2987524 RepID=A0ABT5JUQ8_9BURK|nr:YfiR family protein [Janthinobacterium fluminis]MDC8756150.1 YfiR family protein [Janthinobacterium fluminis]
MRGRRWWCALCCLCAAAAAQAEQGEVALKAAFIYRFAQLTQWPPAPAREFTYCVVGNAPLQEALRVLMQKAPVPARLQPLSEPQQASQCQLLVLGMSGRAELQRWQEALADEPVLTVGDSAESFRSGAVIGLVLEPNGLAFRINHTEAKRRGLALSYQMLKLAREVR